MRAPNLSTSASSYIEHEFYLNPSSAAAFSSTGVLAGVAVKHTQEVSYTNSLNLRASSIIN